MQRTKDYYLALGYDNPYQWAHFTNTPFTKFEKDLSLATIGIVTTAAPFQPDKGDQSGAVYNADAKFYRVYTKPIDPMPDLRISHVAIDRDHTSAEDIGSYLPINALKKCQNEGLIKAVGNRLYGLPTNRSKRTTTEQDIPELIAMIHEDQVDAVVLVPNCPICHQSVSMAARAIEDSGIPTVIMGCAKDIVEHCGVPRFAFSDFPLGNGAGMPHDQDSQDETLRLALKLLGEATAPCSTVQSPLEWAADHDWKLDYSNADRLTADEIKARREAFDAGKTAAKSIRDQS